jgi:imidazolonepropionase-like amidohydrolase
MRPPAILLFALLACSLSATADKIGAEALPILLTNVHVFDVDTGAMSDPQSILVEGNRILSIGSSSDVPADVLQIDCSGKYAVPGLFDCHVHMIHSTEGGEDSLRLELESFVTRGITQVRDVGGPIDVLSRMRERISSAELTGPEIFCTGPMLEGSTLAHGHVNEDFPGFTVALDTPAQVDSILPELARQGACMIKTFNNIDVELYPHIAKVAKENSLRIVHDPGGPLFHWVPMDEAIELGVRSIEHGKAPWPVVLKDDLKEEHDKLVEADEFSQGAFVAKVSDLGLEAISMEKLEHLANQMIEKDVYLCPTLHVLSGMEEMAIEQTKKRFEMEELPPPMLAMMQKITGAMGDVSLFFVTELSKRGVKMLVGQDGHKPEATFEEMRYLKQCDLPESEIIKGATIYPSRWLGVDDRLGSISAGKQANILVMEGNPLEDIGNMESTFLVVQSGRVVFRKS